MKVQYAAEIEKAIARHWQTVGYLTESGEAADDESLQSAVDMLEMDLLELGLDGISVILDRVADGYGS